MNTPLDHELLLILGKGILLSIGLFFLAVFVLRRRSAHTVSLYWRGGLLALLLLPIVSIWFPWLAVAPPADSSGPRTALAGPREPAALPMMPETSAREFVIVPAGEGSVAPVTEIATIVVPARALSQEVGAGNVTSAPEWRAIAGVLFVAIWLLGCVVVMGRWFRAWARLRRLASGAQACDWGADLAALGMAAGRTSLAVSKEVASPLVWGIRRATILLPPDAVGWELGKRRQVLAHELCHVCRRDSFFLLLARLAVALHWMNPLVWIVARRLRLADERTADDAVLSEGSDPGQYAALLATFARQAVFPGAPEERVAPSMANESTVEVRVERILDTGQRRESPRRLLRLVLGVLTIAALSVAGGLSFHSASAQEDSSSPEKGSEEPAAVGAEVAESAAPQDVDLIVEAGEATGVAVLAEVAEINNHKIKHIIIPVIDFENAALSEAIDFLRQRARELDGIEADPDRKGINFVIVGADLAERKINALQLRNVPISTALEFITKQTQTKFEVGEFAISITNAGPVKRAAPGGEMITKLYPAMHISHVLTGASIGDPTKKVPDREEIQAHLLKVFREHGIEFSKESSVEFVVRSQRLLLRSDPQTHDLVAEFLAHLAEPNLPTMVKVRIELYEVPKSEALKVAKLDEARNDGEAAYKRVQTLVGENQAKLLISPSAMIRSGQRTSIRAGSELTHIAAYVEKDGADSPVIRDVLLGSKVDLEPMLGVDENFIDIRYSLYMTRGEARTVKRQVKAPVSGREVEVESVVVDTLTLSQGITTLRGQVQLLGTMQSSGNVDAPNEVVAFLTAHITKVKAQN